MQINNNSPLVAFALVAALSLAACGGSDSGSSDADPCDAAQKVSDAFAAGDGAETDEEISEAIDGFAGALEDLAKVAPAEIKADAELLAKGTRALSEFELGVEPTEEQQEILEDEEYDAAGDRLDAFFEETCGLEF